MNKVVMVFLDAFSSRYLSKAPFLNNLTERGYYTRLKPTFALGKGLGTSIYTGTFRNTNKVWCDYVLSDDPTSNPKMFKYLIKLCDFIPSDKFNKYTRYFLYKFFNKEFGTPNIIPSDLLDFFKLKSRNEKIVTLFEHLKNNNMKSCVSGSSPSIFDPTVKSILKGIKEECDLSFIKFTSLDKLGHKYGPESNKVHERILDIDNILRNVVESESMENTYFIFFSDHGMSPVFDNINLFDMLDKLPVKNPDDYIFFLHSTVACFWFKNNKAKTIINNALENVEFGSVLDRSKLEEVGIDKIGSEYGELIFALKRGYTFFPDFYRKKSAPKGMHGFAYQSYDTPILIIYSSNSSANFERRDVVQHVDIMPTVLDLLKLPIPSTCEGKSLIKI